MALNLTSRIATAATGPTIMSLEEYLVGCRDNPLWYATAAERMVAAIGNPEIVDTSQDERLSRIFSNRQIRRYSAFSDFYGAEEAIESIATYFRNAAAGLEESKQILYLLGPVGGGKSSLAERIKELMEKNPIFILYDENEKDAELRMSPVNDSPLALFTAAEHGDQFEEEFSIPRSYLGRTVISGWVQQKLREFGGDLTKFKVAMVYPSRLNQLGIAKVEPGDDQNQDTSTLIGKTDLRKLDRYAQSHPYSYSYSGGLCRTNQGILDFAEMFKAPIKVLNPLLMATQERNFQGTEAIPAMPYTGIILAHCFSEDTQLLTVNGWRGIDEIEQGDIVATLNRTTGAMEYQPAINKFVYEYTGDMYHMESTAADHLVTPNHKMIYESYGSFKEILAEDFFVAGAKVPVSGILEREDSGLYASEDEIRLHTWCITDGSVHYTRITDGKLSYRFHLKKARKIERLTALLERMGYEYTITEYKDRGTHGIYVRGLDPAKFTKQLDDRHRNLSSREFRVMLEEWSHTDGTISANSNGESFQIQTNVPFHRDLVQELAAISGVKTTCFVANKDGYDPVFMMYIRIGTERVRCDGINKGTVAYSGRVWCLETKNHTLVARRNGKVLITGNSNVSEWDKFRNNKTNEAFLDRVYIVKVPYCLRYDEEEQIYQKMINSSTLRTAPIAPLTLTMLAKFSVLTRMEETKNSTMWAKLHVYNGEAVRDRMPNAKPIDEYRDAAGVDEGMTGMSTRFAFKVISKTLDLRPEERQANPVDLMYVLLEQLRREQLPDEVYERYVYFIRENMHTDFMKHLEKELRSAYLDSADAFGQNMFEQYVAFAEAWIDDKQCKDPDTHVTLDRRQLNERLEAIEKAAAVMNVRDFRNDVVNYVLRYRARNSGAYPHWKDYSKIAEVIEKRMFAATADIMPVISFGPKSSNELAAKHDSFVARMQERGYTIGQIQTLVAWWAQNNKT